MISFEAKNIIEDVIKKHSYKLGDKLVKIVKSKPEEDKLLNAKDLPFVSLITAEGSNDEDRTRFIQFNKDDKKYECFVRTTVRLPIEIRSFAYTERESNFILKNIVRNLPTAFIVEDFEGAIKIGKTGLSDWLGTISEYFLSYCYVEFILDLSTDKKEIPVIKKAIYLN